jgi:hypothetical protein
MADKQRYNHNNTTIIPKQYQNNTRKRTLITKSDVHLPLQGGNLQQSRALLHKYPKKNFAYTLLLFILNMSIKRTIQRKILLEAKASIRSSYI